MLPSRNVTMAVAADQTHADQAGGGNRARGLRRQRPGEGNAHSHSGLEKSPPVKRVRFQVHRGSSHGYLPPVCADAGRASGPRAIDEKVVKQTSANYGMRSSAGIRIAVTAQASQGIPFGLM